MCLCPSSVYLDMVSGNFTDDEKTDLALGGWPGHYLSIMRSLPLLKITVSDTVRLYGYENPKFKSSVEGLKAPDQVNLTYATTAGLTSPPGGYEVNPVADAFAFENYAVLTMPGILTVQKAPLKVTVLDTTRMFGLPNPIFKSVVVGVKNNDGVYVGYSTQAGLTSPVGQYPVSALVDYPVDRYVLETFDGILTVSVFVGIEAEVNEELDIYPNPSRGDISLKMLINGDALQYTVHDSSGRTTASGTLSEQLNVIALEVPDGLYYLKFSNGEVRKLMIKR